MLKIAILALVTALTFSGCVSDDSSTNDHQNVPATSDPRETVLEDLIVPWDVAGAEEFQTEFQYQGGNLVVELRNWEGALAAFDVVNPETCESEISVGGFSSGGGYNSYTIVCPEVPEGIVNLQIDLFGYSSGDVLVENVEI